MRKIRKFIFFSIKHINNIVLFSMFAILLLQVIARKLFNNPLPWPEEISLVTMVWVTFLGAYQCTYEDSHLKMNFLQDKLSYKWKYIIQIIGQLFVIFFLLMINIWAFPFIQAAGTKGMPITSLPMWVPYGMVWISCILMLIEVLIQIFKEFQILLKNFSGKHSGYNSEEGQQK